MAILHNAVARLWTKRVLTLAISLIAVLTLSFLMIQLIPGDPVRMALGPDAPASLVEERRIQLGLDQPLYLQYLNYWKAVLTGQLGSSIITGQPVSLIIESRLGNTVLLVIASLSATMLLSIIVGIVIGIITHGGKRPTARFSFNFFSGFAGALPEFLIAVALVYFFAVTIKIFPVAGAAGPLSFVLPATAITLGSAATMMRIVRSSTATVLDQDYILVARSKRLPRARIYLRHALPNLLTAALTLGGLQLGAIVTGTIVVENVFAIPGLGTALVNALITRDFPVAQILMLIFASSVLILNLFIDILLTVLDPRSTLQEA
ncbi:MAG: ABC transporter permease [Cryobacterium sp.]|nr:ABC transporter permease [Cryobacterium sp.]